MPYKEPALSASAIRYLLALKELGGETSGIKSRDIASRLGVTKPSVHNMLKRFSEKGYAEKEKYGAVRLTAFGRRLAEKYSEQYEILYGRIESSSGLAPEDCRSAVCAVLERTALGEIDLMKEG